MYQYKIGRIWWTQEELTWKQDKQLAALFNRLRQAADGEEEISIDNTMRLLLKHDLLKAFLAIILRPKNRFLRLLPIRPRVNVLSNSQINEIREDFFLSNKTVLTKLSGFGNVLAYLSRAMETLEKQKNTA